MSETDKPGDELRLARTRLDRAAAELDTAIITRLRAARLRTVAAAKARRPARIMGWLPLSAATAAMLVAVTVALLWWRVPEPVTMTTATEDFEWLLAKESPDVFNELEFYHWLGDEHDAS
jgi:hypothetical protein